MNIGAGLCPQSLKLLDFVRPAQRLWTLIRYLSDIDRDPPCFVAREEVGGGAGPRPPDLLLPRRFLPPGTIKVNRAVCAHLNGLLIEPCFTVQKIDYRSFRGSIVGLSFAYCDFSQLNSRGQILSRVPTSAAVHVPMPIATSRPKTTD